MMSRCFTLVSYWWF